MPSPSTLVLVVATLTVAAAAAPDDIELATGVRLVSVPVPEGYKGGPLFGNARSGAEDDTIISRVAHFLQGHEIHVQLPALISKEQLTKAFGESLKAVDDGAGENGETARRRKGGGGGGMIMIMGLMMAKTLAAIGFGGLGLLTMKAMMVSALALMLSAIVGIKKLASSGHDDDGGHQVHYVHADHHRRRRSNEDFAPLAYRGWKHLEQDSQ